MYSKKKSKRTVKTKNGKKNSVRIEIPKNSNVVRSILKLHNEILQGYKISLEKGIQIGKLLDDTKKQLGHSNWLPWVEEYLPFKSRTATNYINLYKYQDEIKAKSARVSNLTDAYRLISDPKNYHRTKTREETKKRRIKFADKKSNFKNSKAGKYEGRVIVGDNYKVMKELIANGMENKYSCIVTSPPYNASFHYSESFNDDKSYPDFLRETLKPFPLYPQLLVKGGRIIYIIANCIKNKDRGNGGDYNHQIVSDLKNGVRKVAPKLRFLNHIIWDKSSKTIL